MLWYMKTVWIFMTFLRKIKYLRNRRNLCIFYEYLFNFPTWTLLNSYVWFSMTFLKETGFPLKPRKLSLNSYVFFTWVICWHVDMYSLLYFVDHKLCSFRLLLMTFAEKTNLLNRRNIFEYLCIMLIMTMFTHDYLVTF